MGISAVSCSKSDNDVEPLRDYEQQKANDMEYIERFMKTHYMTVSADYDVTFTKITTGGETSIWDQNTYTRLTREVKVRQGDNDVTYTIYYYKFREGNGIAPCNVDRVLTAYKGEYIYEKDETVNGNTVKTLISNQFEEMNNPQTYFTLSGVIRGWSEIFPQLKTGTYSSNPDGTVSYNDFGAALMFIPSGLAYYSGSQGGIPAYSPLIFNIKLYELQRVDNDGDGIYSYQEDLNHDGYVYSLPTGEGIVNPDNSNPLGSSVQIAPGVFSKENEVPDFLDSDDDGDYFTTRSEISYRHPNDVLQILRYYPFEGAAVDDPATPYIDETKGVPRKFTGPNNSNGHPTSNNPADFTDPARLRRYLDPTARPVYSDQ